jgi:hypothetical protein
MRFRAANVKHDATLCRCSSGVAVVIRKPVVKGITRTPTLRATSLVTPGGTPPDRAGSPCKEIASLGALFRRQSSRPPKRRLLAPACTVDLLMHRDQFCGRQARVAYHFCWGSDLATTCNLAFGLGGCSSNFETRRLSRSDSSSFSSLGTWCELN